MSITNLAYDLPPSIFAYMNERWSVRVLRDRMSSLLFERTAITKQVVSQLL